jgi:hypothetical protein
MKTKARGKSRNRLAACAALLCALAASLAFAVTPAAAETGDAAPIRPLNDGGFLFPEITGPEAPEEYPFRVTLDEEQELVQVTPTEVGVRELGHIGLLFKAGSAHDAYGSAVPTTLTMSGADLVTWTISYRAGNPAAGGAPFVFPITAGSGWEGGFRTSIVEMNNPMPPTTAPPPSPSPPAPTCTVPSLHDLGLGAAKAKLRAADCAIGQVRSARGATKGKGKVVKQFRPAGTRLAAGTPVAVKLGARS